MYLGGDGLLPQLMILCAVIYGIAVAVSLRYAPWWKLTLPGNSHLFFGALVSMLFLWLLGTRFEVGAVFHLSAMTALTLMVGWQFAIIGGSVVLVGVIVAQQGDWLAFLPSSLVAILIPVMVTWLVLILVRGLLPKNFFIYIFFNAFFTGALASVCSASAVSSLLLLSGVPFDQLWNGFIIWFPLMLFPEAVLNGWIMTILVGLRPQWVATFRDDEYLHGK